MADAKNKKGRKSGTSTVGAKELELRLKIAQLERELKAGSSSENKVEESKINEKYERMMLSLKEEYDNTGDASKLSELMGLESKRLAEVSALKAESRRETFSTSNIAQILSDSGIEVSGEEVEDVITVSMSKKIEKDGLQSVLPDIVSALGGTSTDVESSGETDESVLASKPTGEEGNKVSLDDVVGSPNADGFYLVPPSVSGTMDGLVLNSAEYKAFKDEVEAVVQQTTESLAKGDVQGTDNIVEGIRS